MTPHELIVKYIVPYIRALVALELNSRGLSQVKIAKLFGISQAMVNNYLSRNREYYIQQLEKVGLSPEEIEKYVYSLIASRNSQLEFMYTFTSILNEILATRKLCSLHHRFMPSLGRDCSICHELFHYKVTDPYIKLVEDLVEKFTKNHGAVELVPEIGTNIVYAPPRVRSIQETIAIPGRIVKIDKSVVAVGSPSYGGSRYLATLLLEARSSNPKINIVINIKYKQEYIDKLKELGYEVLVVGPSDNPREQHKKIIGVLKKMKRSKTVVADRGAIGLEPTIYVFHEDPYKLIDDVLSLVS